MILAGIDEAGYGPVLGPLTVGCCALRLPGAEAESVPDVWNLLKRSVSKRRDRTGRKIHVNDSKQVYSPSAGMAELERAVLTWLSASGSSTATMQGVLNALCSHPPHDHAALDQIPWYQHDIESHPAAANGTGVAIGANALRVECGRLGVELLPCAVSVVAEPRFNQLCNATQNKSSVLFTVAMGHVDRLLRNWHREATEEPLIIVCDRHGGRSHYGPLLRLMFEDWNLIVDSEQAKRSQYSLERGGRIARLIFAEKADASSLPTAMASMMAKYVRERLMGRLNAWWGLRVPDLKPTAGYWTDGQRFLADISAVRASLGISDGQFIRAR